MKFEVPFEASYVNLERISQLTPMQALIELRVTNGRGYEGVYDELRDLLKSYLPEEKEQHDLPVNVQSRLYEMDHSNAGLLLADIVDGEQYYYPPNSSSLEDSEEQQFRFRENINDVSIDNVDSFHRQRRRHERGMKAVDIDWHKRRTKRYESVDDFEFDEKPERVDMIGRRFRG